MTSDESDRDQDEALPALPPLDHRDDDDVPLEEDDPTLVAFDDGSYGDPKLDEEAIDLDVGIRIDDSDLTGEDSTQELVLDMTELLNVAEDASSDDSEGPDGMDPSLGIEEPPPGGEDDEMGALDDDVDLLVAAELPGLDADEEGLFDGDSACFIDQGALDEPLPPWAETLWTAVHPLASDVGVEESEGPPAIAGKQDVVCVCPGPPLVALIRGDSDISLAKRMSDGSFRSQSLDPVALQVVRGDHPALAALAEVVAVGDARQGVAVSMDDGRRFERVPGCGGVTALALGEVARRPVLLAALYRESDDSTELVCVDLIRHDAQRVATLPAQPGDEDSYRVTFLLWDEATNQLLAKGNFGTAAFVPPRQ